jgi:hypothetical protein
LDWCESIHVGGNGDFGRCCHDAGGAINAALTGDSHAPHSIMITQANSLKRWSVRYFSALHAAVMAASTEEAAERALELGSQAAVLGLGTLDLARLHEEALTELLPGDGDVEGESRLVGRAAVFFNAVLLPIEQTHAGVMRVETGILKVKGELKKRSIELVEAGRKLKVGIAKRKVADGFLKTSREKSARLLKQSHVLEGELKAVTQKLFDTHETKRMTMSVRLHEEIAVTLLAIHVRLLALKKEAFINEAGLTQEIATASRLVKQSVKTIHHFNREFGTQHEA